MSDKISDVAEVFRLKVLKMSYLHDNSQGGFVREFYGLVAPPIWT